MPVGLVDLVVDLADLVVDPVDLLEAHSEA